eukprot:PRCOL_00002793-RA
MDAAGARNFLVVALDADATAEAARRGWAVHAINASSGAYGALPASRGAARRGEVVSALKYGVVSAALALGYATLVCDLDVAVLRDPFAVLVRDCDVEGASDGWDDETVRGSLGVNSWGGVHLQRAHVNAGFFWVRAGIRTAAAMAAVAARLAMAPAWDQLVLNEELHAPALVAPGGQSYGSAGLSDHAMVMAGSAGLSVRVVPLDVFCASRAYFRMASSGGLADSLASVHVNYHSG